jgi:hypothetical protein
MGLKTEVGVVDDGRFDKAYNGLHPPVTVAFPRNIGFYSLWGWVGGHTTMVRPRIGSRCDALLLVEIVRLGAT